VRTGDVISTRSSSTRVGGRITASDKISGASSKLFVKPHLPSSSSAKQYCTRRLTLSANKATAGIYLYSNLYHSILPRSTTVMAHLTPYPPSRTHTSTRLTHSEAHEFLSSFLALTDTTPAYRPDSTLTNSGPISTSAGSGTNLTLAHLRRVLAGMKGEKIGGATMMDGFGSKGGDHDEGGESRQDESRPRKRPRRDVELDGDGEIVLEEQATTQQESEWQAKDDFELEQEEVVATVAEVADEQPQMGEGNGEEVAPEEAELDAVSGGKSVDKKERKKLKKQRAQDEKRAREEERRKKAK
jgi:hypothetical protein